MNLNQKRITVENNKHKEGNQARDERETYEHIEILQNKHRERRSHSEKKQKVQDFNKANHVAADIRIPIRPVKPGPIMQRMMKRNAAVRVHQMKLQIRKKIRWQFLQLHARLKLQNLRASHGNFDQFLEHIKGNEAEFAKYCMMVNLSPTAENREKLFANPTFKFQDSEIPNQITDPSGYKQYIKSLFNIEKKPLICQLRMVPYLRKIQKKINIQLAANTKTSMGEIDYKKPLQLIRRVQHFLPFGFLPRLGVYEGRNSLHLLPLKEQYNLLNPIKKPTIRKLIKRSPAKEQPISEQTEKDWLSLMFKKFEAIDNQPIENFIFEKKNDPNQLDDIPFLDQGNCVCHKCHHFMKWDNLYSPHWWNETFGCPFTGFMGEYFKIEKGPFFDKKRKQIQPFEFRDSYLNIRKSNLFDVIRFSELEKPDCLYQEQFTPLQQQLYDQIQEISHELKYIQLDFAKEQYQLMASKKQQLYKKKHTIIQKFLGSIFDAEAPRNLHQYLTMYKLKIRVGDQTVSYIPQCPENYKAFNPVINYPKQDEHTGQIQYIPKIKHQKKSEKKQIFNITKHLRRVKENLFNPLELIHQQIEEDTQAAEKI